MVHEIQTVNAENDSAVDHLNPDAGAFLGAFMSEGNLTEKLSIKITCKNINFIKSATESIRNILGDAAATRLPPTPEHQDGEEGFHKYYSVHVARFLISSYGVVPGRRVLVNSGLPTVIMNNKTDECSKEWLRRYLQMRLSGDGHVRNTISAGKCGPIITRRVCLTRCLALDIDNDLSELVKINFGKNKPIRNYPEDLVERLKTVMKSENSFPKEFLDIRRLLLELFEIESKIYPYGLRCIYFDKKRKRYIASAIYKLIISRMGDIIRFQNKINFPDFDSKNREKLLKLIASYK